MIIEVKVSSQFGENVINMEDYAAKELLRDLIDKSVAKMPLSNRREAELPPPMQSTGAKITTRPHGSRNASLFGADWREQARGGNFHTESENNATQSAQRATKGFLICECESCGAVKAFCAKKPITYNICSACGHRTDIKESDMKIAYADCSCGESFRYHTNATQEVLDHLPTLREDNQAQQKPVRAVLRHREEEHKCVT